MRLCVIRYSEVYLLDIPDDSTTRQVLKRFFAMLVEAGYSMENIRNTLAEMAREKENATI